MAAAGGAIRPAWESPPPAWLLALTARSRVFATLSLMEPFSEFRLLARYGALAIPARVVRGRTDRKSIRIQQRAVYISQPVS